MEHIKMKKHVLKKAGGFLLLTAVILAGSTWERRTAGDRQPQFYAGGERSTRNSALKKQRTTGKISR